jgi:hypothetical protein
MDTSTPSFPASTGEFVPDGFRRHPGAVVAFGAVRPVGERPVLCLRVLDADAMSAGEMTAEHDEARVEPGAHVAKQLAGLVCLAFGVGEGGEEGDRVADLTGHPAAEALRGLPPDQRYCVGQAALDQEGEGPDVIGREGWVDGFEPGESFDRRCRMAEEDLADGRSLAARGAVVG